MPPKKRTSLRARAAIKSTANHSSASTVSASTPTSALAIPRTKKAKRTLKHDQLLRRVRDSGIQKHAAQSKRRRRPQNKLRAAEDIADLRDALPTISSPTQSSNGDEEEEEEDGWEGIDDSDDEMGITTTAVHASAQRRKRRRKVDTAQAKMKLKSLQHRPGAMKRKRALEQREVERFGRNLAQMVLPTNSSVGGENNTQQREKWAALRRFIGGTMEKNEMFESRRGLGVGVG